MSCCTWNSINSLGTTDQKLAKQFFTNFLGLSCIANRGFSRQWVSSVLEKLVALGDSGSRKSNVNPEEHMLQLPSQGAKCVETTEKCRRL